MIDRNDLMAMLTIVEKIAGYDDEMFSAMLCMALDYHKVLVGTDQEKIIEMLLPAIRNVNELLGPAEPTGASVVIRE